MYTHVYVHMPDALPSPSHPRDLRYRGERRREEDDTEARRDVADRLRLAHGRHAREDEDREQARPHLERGRNRRPPKKRVAGSEHSVSRTRVNNRER